MRLAILSDIHDHLHNLAAAVRFISDADALLCCGDLCSPFVVDQLARFPRDVHIIFGNNDADLFRITAKAAKLERFHLHGELLRTQWDGLRVAANHFDYVAKPLAKSGEFDVVCFGHNHEWEIARDGSCQLINPGAIMGAKFSLGDWEEVTPTFAVLDTVSKSVATYEIDAKTGLVGQR